MGIRCVSCGKTLTISELMALSCADEFQGVFSLRQKLLRHQDKALRTYVIHRDEAKRLISQGNGFKQGIRVIRGRKRVQTEYAVLNGKIFIDDFPHCNHGHRLLTPTQINNLMHFTPRKRRLISCATKKEVLELHGHKCARCGTTTGLEFHHKKWVVQGGSNELSNLVVLCIQCHRKYGGEFTDWTWPVFEKLLLESEPIRMSARL